MEHPVFYALACSNKSFFYLSLGVSHLEAAEALSECLGGERAHEVPGVAQQGPVVALQRPGLLRVQLNRKGLQNNNKNIPANKRKGLS